MIELSASDPFAGLHLPLVHGAARLDSVPPVRITAIAPLPGQTEALACALGGFPAPGEVLDTTLRLVWVGRGQAFAFGEGLPEGLERHAALSDQSDGWAGAQLEGADAQAVLARLVAMDLRALAVPSSVRTLLGHLPLLLVKQSETAFDLWTYRSMAGSLSHELDRAMRMVAARRALA